MKAILRSSLIPLATFLLVVATTLLAHWYYWDSGQSPIKPNVAPSAEVVTFSGILTMLVIVFVKFFLYDAIGRLLLRKTRGAGATIWFYAIYGLGIAIDLFCVVMASRPLVASGFAVLGMIFYTPVILAIGIAGLLVWRKATRPRH